MIIQKYGNVKDAAKHGVTDMKKCPIKSNKFWGDEIQHTWGYITKEHRKCIVCKIEEILLGFVGQSNCEDWRRKYKGN